MLTKMVAPDWGNRLVTEITPFDVEKLLNRIAAGRSRPSKAKPNNRARKLQGAKPTPVRANRIGEVLRKMFTYAESWGWCESNPASGFRRRIENPRERFLSHEEIRKLAEALEAAEDRRAADIIRLCMLTGARLGEVRQARFEHFNLEHLSWSKPASMTKQRKIHRLPISDEAAAIVRQRQLLVPRGCPLLFPGDVPGQPVKEIRRFWRGIQKVVGIPDVRIHDLRHTFASLLVSGGASLEMIGKLLGSQPDADHPALCPPDGLAPARWRRCGGLRSPARAETSARCRGGAEVGLSLRARQSGISTRSPQRLPDRREPTPDRAFIRHLAGLRMLSTNQSCTSPTHSACVSGTP